MKINWAEVGSCYDITDQAVHNRHVNYCPFWLAYTFKLRTLVLLLQAKRSLDAKG